MFIRFVGPDCDHMDRHAFGLFHFFYERCEGFDASANLMERMQEEIDWFKTNLPVPNENAFDYGRRIIEESAGLCWFKETAIEALDHAFSLQRLLDEACVPIRLLKTSNPGIILYQDQDQVIAKPTKAAVRQWR